MIHILDIFAKDQIENGTLVPLFTDWQTSVKTFFAVTPASRYVAPKTRALIDFLMTKLDRSRRPPVDTMVQKV